MPTEKRRTKKEVIESAWDELGSESVGARELDLIQEALAQTLGSKAIDSPAQIARTLADLGAPLRHPEVMSADLIWRETHLETLFEPGDVAFENIEKAVLSMQNIETRRSQFLAVGDEIEVESLREYIRELKVDLGEQGNEVAKEVSQWLTIWLQNPEIFTDWLSLRLKSPEFIEKFS